MSVHFIVKGGRRLAEQMSASRLIPTEFVRENRGGEETTLETDDGHWVDVASWFGEPPFDAPFPQGTLLHFSSR